MSGAGATQGVPPWHMWGTSQNLLLQIPGTGSSTSDSQSSQLVRVSYKRPETWRFVIGGEIQSVEGLGGVANVFVDFALTIGVGRSQITIPKWISMVFALNGTFTDLRQIWTTSATLPQLDSSAAPDPFPRTSNTVVAQDIQVAAAVNLAGFLPARVAMKLDAYFAPNAHARPDWFHGQFDGAIGGH